MSEYEELLSKILEQRSELTRTDLEEKINQKKEKIGAGYLTDQGALFLIASDLGITLEQKPKIDLGLKDLYIGAKEVSLESRVLSISQPREFSRKDGSSFLLRTMTIYDDKDSAMSVKLWDDKANLPGLENLKPGDLIKIIKAYVKSDLNGSPTINIGSGSDIEPVNSDSKIPTIDSITIDVNEITEGQDNLVVSGKLDGIIDTMQFTNQRGNPGKALRLRLKGKNGDSLRVVLWGKDEKDIPRVISPNSAVKLLSVRAKMGNFGLEIHGNDSTVIDVEGSKEAEPIIVRIISINQNEGGKNMVIGIDENRNMFYFTDSANMMKEFGSNDVIECMPSKVYGNSITIDNDSLIIKKEDNTNIPDISELRTKISDIKAGNEYCVEAIVLKMPEKRDIQTKSGETVMLGEMFVEDDSGQVWIKGWRNLARLVETCSIGEIISVTAVNAKAGLEGRVELFLSPYSTITKKN